MKCATLTFHRTTNYGAMFQTYALQRAISNLGGESEVIDYRSPVIEERYKKCKLYHYFDPRFIYAILIRNSYIRDNRKSFNLFSNKYIKKSSLSFSTAEELKRASVIYDKILVGSDQVWNPNCTGWDSNYFLPFVESEKRNSYAASFGFSSCAEREKDWLRHQLIGFNKVSLRELSGAHLYNDITGKTADVVLDPTFLLAKEDWATIANEAVYNKPYVLIYLLAESKSIFSFAKGLAKKKGCDVYYINDRLLPIAGVNNLFYTSPSEWLRLFLNADTIVTNSFHGMAFSINLNKQFWAELLPPPALVNARIVDLLEMFGLTDRLISNGIDLETKIDYGAVNEVLNTSKSKSLAFLKSALFD